MPWSFYSPTEYRKFLSESGLRMKRVELIPKTSSLTAEGLKGWIQTTWLPYLARCPNDRQIEFLNDLVGRYLKRHPLNSHGKTTLKMMRLEVEAER